MRLTPEFDRFLQIVNLSPGRLQTLRDRVETIEGVLRDAQEPELEVLEARPQGSLAQRTIINPVDERRGFDADLLVECEDRFATVADMLGAVERVLSSSARHANLVEPKTRCVTLQYAGEYHLDVVPCVRRDGELKVGNVDTGDWETTDPDGYSQWLLERDAHTQSLLVPTIRLCKYLRDYKGRPKIKSVILTTILAERAAFMHSAAFTDLPTALVLLLEETAAWSAQFADAPYLTEPTTSAELRLDDTDWPAFVNQMESLAMRAREAYGHADEDRSLALWRGLFGKRFPAPQARVAKSGLAPGEQDLYRNFGIPTDATQFVSIDARVRPKGGFPGGPIASVAPLEKYRSLVFELSSTSVTEPFDVYWKVRNTGAEAAAAGALRGEIRRDDKGPNALRTESTKYTGQHWVHLYVVKDEVCVAIARANVAIA